VQPLADDRFLEIEPLAALGVDAGPTQLRALFWDRGLRNVVLCTHGEVIGRLLVELVAEGLVVEDLLGWPEGSTWLCSVPTEARSMVASWPRWRSRNSSSPGPEAVPVNDQLLGMVTDCPPAQHLVVTMATTGLVDPTLALGAAKVRPPAPPAAGAGGSREQRARRGLPMDWAAVWLLEQRLVSREPGATPGRRAALAAFTATASAQSR
jgi:hypothetical protein